MDFKIIYTSDVHGYFFPTDYLDREYKETGLLSLASKYNKDENTIIIDGGDMLQGSSFDYYLQKENKPEVVADIMNLIGVDFYTLGNHDFNFGYEYLLRYTKSMKATLLCANVQDKTGQMPIKKSHIFNLKNGLKIGITGVVTDWINIWEKPENITNFEITDPFEGAKSALEKMGDCDFKVCIYHGGYEIDLETKELVATTDENIGGKIAKELNFDILLTGHQHIPMEGKVLYNSYTLQTPPNGEKFALLTAEKSEEEKIYSSKLIEPGKEPLNEPFEKYKDLNEEVQSFLDSTINSISRDYLPEDRLKMAMEGSELADLINSVQLQYSKANISITSFANEISGIKKKVTIRDILNTYRFPNSLIVLEIDGKSLREALEQNYTYIDYDGENFKISNNFLEPKKEHYNFDFFYGIDFEIDFKKPKYERIGRISFNGKEVLDEDKLKIAMNNYRASGAGNFNMYTKLKTIYTSDQEVQNILIEYFENKGIK